jgi:cephalosporin hydroxylase
MANLYDLIMTYDKLFPVKHGGILQSLDELEQLVTELGNRKFDNMVEIGSCFGGTVWLYSQLFGAPEAKFTIIDIKIDPVLDAVIEELHNRRPDIAFITKEQPSSIAEIDKCDFLHIDADHRYHMVKADYERFAPKVVNGGIILLHDTLLDEGPGDHKSGCIRFRKELEANGEKMKTFGGTMMLCDCFGPNKSNPDNRSIGISVVYK